MAAVFLSLVKGFNNEHRLFLLAPPGESLDLFLAEGISHYPFPRFEQHPSGIPAFIRGLKQIIRMVMETGKVYEDLLR
jgi:hypothetical protein